MIISSPLLISITSFFAVANTIWVYLLMGVVIFASVLIAILIGIKKKPNQKAEVPIDASMIVTIIDHLGGLDNISDASQEGARLNIKVNDVKRCDLESIKKLGALGIFVSGKAIKFILPTNTQPLVDYITKNIEER